MPNDLEIRVTVSLRTPPDRADDLITGEIFFAKAEDSPFYRIGWFPAATYYVRASRWIQIGGVSSLGELLVCLLSRNVRTKYGRRYVKREAEKFLRSWRVKKNL